MLYGEVIRVQNGRVFQQFPGGLVELVPTHLECVESEVKHALLVIEVTPCSGTSPTNFSQPVVD